MSHLHISVFNKNHAKIIDYFDKLKEFFKECIITYNNFWLDKIKLYTNKKEILINKIEKNKSFISILISVNIEIDKNEQKIIKFIFNGNKYYINNFNNIDKIKQKNIELIELYKELINKMQNKITIFDKLIKQCKKTNINKTNIILDNYVNDKFNIIKKTCIKLYLNNNLLQYLNQNNIDIKQDQDLLRNNIINNLLITHHDNIIQPGISLLFSNFI
jgi:hypothetical protein